MESRSTINSNNSHSSIHTAVPSLCSVVDLVQLIILFFHITKFPFTHLLQKIVQVGLLNSQFQAMNISWDIRFHSFFYVNGNAFIPVIIVLTLN